MVDPDSLHRLAKVVVDSGLAPTFTEGDGLLRNLCVNIYIGPEIESALPLQAALATIINIGRRTFLGGVYVVAEEDYQIRTPWSQGKNLSEIIKKLGAVDLRKTGVNAASIVIGHVDENNVPGSRNIQVTFDGWTAVVLPLGSNRLPERGGYPIAGALAGAIAVSEVFLAQLSNNALACRREIKVNLWPADDVENILESPILYLPSKLWMIGLGHLGQAVLWMLGLLPYKSPNDVQLFLQDYDSITPSNDSTCLLTTLNAVGKKKTRWVAECCERRGFRTTICERRFDGDLVLHEDEPELCLCLPDNILARVKLDRHPFRYVIEAGLGSAYNSFTQFIIHTFPGAKTPSELWSGTKGKVLSIENLSPAYKELRKDGLDECGLIKIANLSVGAPFVGAVTACFIVSEVIRLLNNGPLYDVIQGDVKDLAHVDYIKKECDFKPYNFGITPSAGDSGSAR